MYKQAVRQNNIIYKKSKAAYNKSATFYTMLQLVVQQIAQVVFGLIAAAGAVKAKLHYVS